MRLFAALRERAGSRSVELELPDGAIVADVWGKLGLGEEPDGLLYARSTAGMPRRALSSPRRRGCRIPPVSGGASGSPRRRFRSRTRWWRYGSDEAGAIATFIGTTRARSRGRDVIHLEQYEAYEGMAEVMASLASELVSRHDLCHVAIHHRVGRVDIGETSVVIAVSAPHRAAALAACQEAIDELKVTVPLWKKRSTRAAKSGSGEVREHRS